MTSQRRQLETRARNFSPLMRMFVVLLCALYVVAPLWHVCEMSGSHCEHMAPEKSPSSTRLAAIAFKEAHFDEAHHHASGDSAYSAPTVELCHDEEECLCPDHSSSAGKQLSGQAQVSSRDGGFSGTCLAMLLTTMPGRVVASFGFVPLFSQRTLAAIFSFVARPIASLPQPPARGPPCSV